MTYESARVSDFSQNVIFAVKWHIICDLTVAMIDKTSSGFNLCCHKNLLHLRQYCIGQWFSKWAESSQGMILKDKGVNKQR